MGDYLPNEGPTYPMLGLPTYLMEVYLPNGGSASYLMGGLATYLVFLFTGFLVGPWTMLDQRCIHLFNNMVKEGCFWGVFI